VSSQDDDLEALGQLASGRGYERVGKENSIQSLSRRAKGSIMFELHAMRMRQ